MKTYIISMVAATLLTSSLCATSLKDVVEQTIDANPDILSEKFNKDAYKKYVDEEKGDYYPTINFSGFLEDSKTRYNRDNQIADPTTEDKDGWNASITVDQIIYDGGVTPSEVEEYKHIYYGNKYRSTQRVEEILRGAIDSYMDLVMYQELMNLSENNLKLHDDYLVIAREKESISGETLESYQVNSKKHYITDRYLEQKQSQDEALNQYMKYTQRQTDGNICRPKINESIIPNTLQKILEIADKKNFKILEQIEKIKEQRENLEQASANYLPTLRFQWQSTWDNDLEEAENGRQDISRARLILDWNIFEGGKTYHATQREKLFLQEQQKVLDNIVNEVEEEVTTAYNSYFITKQRVENLKKYVNDNKNIRDVYLKQLQDGTRTFIDILDAESELYRSEISTLEQEMDMYAKYFDLLEKTGMLSETILKSGDQVCKAYVSKEYINPMKKPKNQQDEQLDEDLLNELGVETSSLDAEINKLINTSAETATDKKENNKKPITLPNGKYTINMATLDNKVEDIKSFKQKYNLLNNKSLYTYNMSLGTKVLYGSFDSLSEANQAITDLDNQGIDLKVYVDYMNKHKKLLEKYKNIN